MNFTATYSPEDNKLRLYSATRLDRGLYDKLRALGFQWAPKQELFVAPSWSPGREDFLLTLVDEIEDEHSTMEERAAQRAERFAGYRTRRIQDAREATARVESIAGAIPLGQPILVGHHSESRARKDAEKIQRQMDVSVTMWSRAEYWKSRAAGALAHASYKAEPDVRLRRITSLEAEQRKWMRAKTECEKLLAEWNKTEGITRERALAIANLSWVSACFPLAKYPRLTLDASKYEGQMSIWSALNGNVIGPETAREISVRSYQGTIARSERWLTHLFNRLEYERAMLGDYNEPERPKSLRQVLPILNYWPEGGKVSVLNRYGRRGEVTEMTVVRMTKAQYANVHNDYKGTSISADKTHRVRVAMHGEHETGSLRSQLCAVFLTDSKVHDLEKARATLPLTPVQAEPEQRPVFVPRERSKPSPEEAAETQEAESARALAKAGVSVAVSPTLYPTPPDVARRLVDLAGRPVAGCKVLEPSAGTGNLIKAIWNAASGPDCCILTAVEIHAGLYAGLSEMSGYYVGSNGANTRLVHADFLNCQPIPRERHPDGQWAEHPDNHIRLGLFDIIVMNPPFNGGSDIKHVQHARRFLTPGGVLLGICASGPRQHEQIKPLTDHWEELPEGTFSGTNVRAAMFRIQSVN